MNPRGSLAGRVNALEKSRSGMPSAAESRAAFAAMVARDVDGVELIYGGGTPGTRSLTYPAALALVAEEEAAFREVYGEGAGRLYR